MKVGDLVKYMSRTVLITGFDTGGDWVYGIELDDDRATIGKYKSHALRAINEDR